MSPRILVVDDKGEIASLVCTSLEENDYEVLVAYDGETALQMLRRERPDLVLLDLMTPQGDGWDVARVVQHGTSLAALPVMELTDLVEGREAKGALTASSLAGASPPLVNPAPGASGAEALPFNPQDVAARVRAVLRRLQAEPPRPRVIQVQALAVDLVARRVEVRGQSLHLTPTEFALLRALAERPGQALSRQAMIENGPGPSYDGRQRTVDSHVKNLRRKLDEAGEAAHLIKTVFGVGYRLATGDEA